MIYSRAPFLGVLGIRVASLAIIATLKAVIWPEYQVAPDIAGLLNRTMYIL